MLWAAWAGSSHLLGSGQRLLSSILGQYNCHWLLFLILKQVQNVIITQLPLHNAAPTRLIALRHQIFTLL